MIFFYLWILTIFYPPPTASTMDMAPITLQLITYQVQKNYPTYNKLGIPIYQLMKIVISFVSTWLFLIIDLHDFFCFISHIFLPFWENSSKLAGNWPFWNHLGNVWNICSLFVPGLRLSFCKLIITFYINLSRSYKKFIRFEMQFEFEYYRNIRYFIWLWFVLWLL